MERIGLGLIGCGGIARSAHLPAMGQLADRVVLLATADTAIAAATEPVAQSPLGTS